ncbi:hypothetical protein [Brevundimonas vesicularis]|uniref:hypothetical protein n=1 Tax=Brevundimonas vesicularis TaxID=41276 RepID=UPI0038D46E69
MTDSIRPVAPPGGPSIQERREGERRGSDRREASAAAAGPAEAEPEAPDGALVVPVVEITPAMPAAPLPVPPAAFAAQVIGQSGQRRGLKGGPPVLDAARVTYLGTEYSGRHDRRPAPGRDTETEI